MGDDVGYYIDVRLTASINIALVQPMRFGQAEAHMIVFLAEVIVQMKMQLHAACMELVDKSQPFGQQVVESALPWPMSKQKPIWLKLCSATLLNISS